MARSSAIWVVSDPAKRTNPVSTWTVKHEMITWLKRQPVEALYRMEVLRYPDGTRWEWVGARGDPNRELVERIEPEWFTATSLLAPIDLPPKPDAIYGTVGEFVAIKPFPVTDET